jgi:hypothetical protein
MTPTPVSSISIEPSPDHIVRDLHRIREAIVDSFGGDLHAIAADAQRRLEESGRTIWRHQSPDQVAQMGCCTGGTTVAPKDGPIPTATQTSNPVSADYRNGFNGTEPNPHDPDGDEHE